MSEIEQKIVADIKTEIQFLDRKITGFKQTLHEFLSSKTNWLAITGVAGAVAGYLTHQLTLMDAVNMGGAALGLLFIRDAVHQNTP